MIYVHQRGWGKSRPQGSLEGAIVEASLEAANVPKILEDLEAVRERLGLARWLVCGGSTGALLALAYSTDYPQHCLGVILRYSRDYTSTAERFHMFYSEVSGAWARGNWSGTTSLHWARHSSTPRNGQSCRFSEVQGSVGQG